MKQRPETIRILAKFLLFFGVSQSIAGTYVEQKVSSSQRGMNMQVQAWMDGDSGKVEFVKSDSDVTPKDSYLLSNDGGKTVYLVNPNKKTYSLWDMDAMFVTLSELTKDAEGVIDIMFKDAEAEDLGTEPGGQILGVNTTKKTWRTAYSMEMKVVFMEKKQYADTRIEAWMTNDISLPALNSMWFAVTPPTTGNSDLDYVLTESTKRVDGTPLKVVQNTTISKKKKGRGKSEKITMEIVALREEPVDPAMFAMPVGYNEVPLIDYGGQGTTANDASDSNDPLKDLGGIFEKGE